jgi:hypothetical protein
MHVAMEDFGTGWCKIEIGIREDEIDTLIKLLGMLKKDTSQHFHAASHFREDGGIADIEFYIETREDTDNMQLLGLAIPPNR